MRISLSLILAFLLITLFNTGCRKNVRGDVRIYGVVRDAFDNAPIENMQFELARIERRSGETLLSPTITYDKLSGTYEVNHITIENAQRGYYFRWWTSNAPYEYYYDNLQYGQELIDGNDCPIDLRLKRVGYMKVRLIDVAPFDFWPNLEFSCDGNERPIDLYNFSGDETFTVKLIPDHDNFYELTSRSNNFIDTVLLGNINMNASGDTLFNTLQF